MVSLSITGTIGFPLQILHSSGIPGGLRVAFYDLSLGAERELGKIDKVEAARFTKELSLPGGSSIDLVVRIFKRDSKEPIISSPVYYGVSGNIDVVIDFPDPLAALPEYERVAAMLAPWLRGRAIAALPAGERAALPRISGVEEKLIVRLAAAQARAVELGKLLPAAPAPTPAPARKSGKGLAAQALEALEEAATWIVDVADLGRTAEAAIRELRALLDPAAPSSETGPRPATAALHPLVPPLYALAAGQGDVPLPALLLRSRGALQRALEQAAKDKVVAAPAPKAAVAIVNALTAGRDLIHFNLADDGRFALAKAIAWAPVPADLRSRMLDAVLDAGGTTAAFESAALTAAQKSLLAEAFALFGALRSHAPMLAALAQDKGTGGSILRPGGGLDQDRLHLMEAVDWRRLIDRAGFPDIYADRPEPAAAYAADIAASIAGAAPGRNLAARLAASRVHGSTALARALADHPMFDIRTQPVQTYFAAPEKGEAPLLNRTQVELLAAVQRTMQLAPDHDFATAEVLIESGYTSGYGLLIEGLAGVQHALVPKLGNELTTLIYHNAQQVFADAYTIGFAGEPYWLPGMLIPDADTPALPNLTTLFGNADFCTCAHCQSVYGPAAYLADLLHWMRADVFCTDTGKSAYGVLAARRPDIPNILLNCSNANTVMPYIDIVNEVLSYGLLSPSGNRPSLGDLQTHGESADRLLEPEHRGKFGDVDALLLKTDVTWALPYDPLYDEARAYLDALGRDHADLVGALIARDWTTATALERQVWAQARFGLIPEEFALITHMHGGTSFWKNEWGLTAAPGDKVKPLLDTQEFEDLAALEAVLRTKFVRGPANAGFPFDHILFAEGAPCDIDQARLADVDDNPLAFDIAAADRAMRFERMRRRARLTTRQLDRALSAFGNEKLDEDFVAHLGAATEAAARLGAPLDDLLGWFDGSAADPAAGFAAALGLKWAEFTAALELIDADAAPWAGPDDTLQFINAVGALGTVPLAPSEIRDMLAGTGNWALNAGGKATARAFAASAKAAWEAMEDALAPLPSPPPGVTQLTAAEAQVKAQRDATIDLALATAVGLPVSVATMLVTTYRSAAGTLAGAGWRALFDQPLTIVDRTWDTGPTAVEGRFTELYRYLLRTARIMKAAELDEAAMQLLVFTALVIASPPGFFTAAFPVGLDLLLNSFGGSALVSAVPIAWLRRAAGQAMALAVTQWAFFVRTGELAKGNAVSPFKTWAAAEMDIGSVFAGLTGPERRALADKAQLFEPASDFGALVQRMFDLSALEEDVGLPLDPLVGLVWTTVPTVANRFGQGQVTSLKAALRAAAGGDAAWTARFRPIQNRLRRNLRDALVAFYLGQHLHRNVPQLYAHFLIDPEMEPCMKTSRIVQATNACQTLIQRGLLGLEPDVCMGEVDKKEWVWRRNYRVWEANRKVFLYPENWIDPSLRLVKSPFFAEAQEKLLQDELNAVNVEKAFNAYLTRLENVSRLDMRGHYYDEPQEVMHVFARTWSPPYTYFYRRRESNARWTAWEEIPIDIQGDHLIPMIFNRRLYLFWPTFTPKEHRVHKIAGDRGAPYVELRLCHSKLEFGKWAPKKQHDKVWICGTYSGASLFDESKIKSRLIRVEEDDAPYAVQDASLDPEGFFFWAQPSAGDLVIHVRRLTDRGENVFHLFTHEVDLVISGCDERLSFRRPNQPSGPDGDSRPFFLAAPVWTVPSGMQLAEGELLPNDPYTPTIAVRVNHNYSVGSTGNSAILLKAHLPFSFTYAHQDRDAVPVHPFFVADRRHTHLITRNRTIYGSYYGYSFDRYTVELHEHPHCCRMLQDLNRDGIEGLLAPDGSANPLRRQQLDQPYFPQDYEPTSEVYNVHPTLSFDFTYTGAYSTYNWEIFFHLPALIGHQLRLDGKHAEALRWLSFIFDPTNRDDISDSSRFWMIQPFHEHITEGSIAALMQLLQSSKPQDQAKRQAFAAQISEWRKHPFEPHAVAEMRIQAYMRWTVMEYIETLIDWGDKLFRQFTTESVNEALQLYMLASEILGPKPRQTQGKTRPDKTFLDLLASLDDFSNAAAAMENAAVSVSYAPVNGNPKVVSPPALYFCIPENPQLLAYWDKVANRLFCIRNCRDIEGNERELALFAREIDPGMLVKAVASGLDLSEILDSLAAPNPRHRFSYLLQSASSFCNDVKALGGQLLAALEKRDAEELGDLRQVHEINLLGATRGLKTLALEEAKQSLAAAEAGKKLAQTRLDHYSSLPFMIPEESTAKALTESAHDLQIAEHALMVLSAAFALLDLRIGTSGNGIHFAAKLDLAKAPSFGAQAAGAMASTKLNKAGRALTSASYVHRQKDVMLQTKLAQQEIQQADKQIAAAEIRLAMAEKELENHDLQVEQSKAVHDWMRSKFSNEELYGWMSGKLKTLHRQAYNLAFDLAKQAQKAFQLELGRTESYVQFGDWDSSRQGLLAGEMLSGQLRELEAAYMRFNTRDFELSRSISLRLLDPAALLKLIREKKAEFEIPEWLLATIFPGMKLYAMRIKSVAVSLPCVTGPHVPTNVRLRLLKSAIGWKPTDILPSSTDLTSSVWLTADMANEIVTSSGVNDPALFEPNLRDERFLPFENAGAVSQWEVSLPETAEFDHQTISDLILHIRFVARGGAYTAPLSPPADPRPNFLMSWRHDFPDQWTALLATLRDPQTSSPAALTLPTANSSDLPYRWRSAAGTSLTPLSCWIMYRTADGARALSEKFDYGPNSFAEDVAIVASSTLPDSRVLVVVLPAGDAPELTYEAAAAHLVVEDILIAFQT